MQGFFNTNKKKKKTLLTTSLGTFSETKGIAINANNAVNNPHNVRDVNEKYGPKRIDKNNVNMPE